MNLTCENVYSSSIWLIRLRKNLRNWFYLTIQAHAMLRRFLSGWQKTSRSSRAHTHNTLWYGKVHVFPFDSQFSAGRICLSLSLPLITYYSITDLDKIWIFEMQTSNVTCDQHRLVIVIFDQISTCKQSCARIDHLHHRFACTQLRLQPIHFGSVPQTILSLSHIILAALCLSL